MLKLALGVSVLFCPTLALPEPVLPFGPSLTERGVCGVEKAKGELRLGRWNEATAVITDSEWEEVGSGEECCSNGDSSRTTASPRHAIPMPAPDAQS